MNQWCYPAVAMVTLVGMSACYQPVESGSADSLEEAGAIAQTKPAPAHTSPDIVPSPHASPLKTHIPESSIELPPVEPLDLKGDMVVAGSSTVFPLTRAMYHLFIQDGYAGVMKIDALGTKEGFRLFCTGQSDIVNASRAIKPEETAACEAIGRQPMAFRIGTDALVVVVNPQNDWISTINLKDLADMFAAENWSNVNSAYPEEPIQRFLPGLNSGTLDFFVGKVYGGSLDLLLQSPNTEFGNTHEALLRGVSQNRSAIAVLNYAFYHQHAGALKALTIEGVEATALTVEQNQYPLARPLFIYSDATIMASKPQVAAFINFYLTHVYQGISQVGYFPASSDILDQEKTKFLDAID